jgi:hypothetical protein
MDGAEMIKRKSSPEELDAYVCDNCIKEAVGTIIMVYYPYGHINESTDGPSHFCSDKCLIEFQQKITKKYGYWKSTPPEPVRSSQEDRKAYTRTKASTGTGDSPKARRGAKKKTHKPNAPEEA